MQQQTIAEKISCTGTGLHNGRPVQLTLHPARAGSGIVFVRTDTASPVEIPARAGAVACTRFATSLGAGDVRVGTVEHLMSALYGLGIDNLRVELDGPELPVMDGSAASFVYLIRSAGIFGQREARRVLRVRRPVSVQEGDCSIRVTPSRTFKVSYAVDFDHPAIGRQEFELVAPSPEEFEREIAPARTFGFLHEVRRLWQAGFARGGSLENAVVLGDHGVMNPGGLRWGDEFVRHKVLDLFGDLALLGLPIQGHVQVERGGHGLHQRLLAALLARRDASFVCEDGGRRVAGIDLDAITA